MGVHSETAKLRSEEAENILILRRQNPRLGAGGLNMRNAHWSQKLGV